MRVSTIVLSSLSIGCYALPSALNTPCVSTDDCNEFFEYCEQRVCVHKSFFPVHGLEIGGLFVLAIVMLLSNAGGMSGGIIIMPIVMSFFQFETKSAIALSNFLVFVSCLTRYATNFNTPHPESTPYWSTTRLPLL